MTIENNYRIYYWANLLGSIGFMGPVMSLFYLHRGLQYSDFFILLIIIAMIVITDPLSAERIAEKGVFLYVLQDKIARSIYLARTNSL